MRKKDIKKYDASYHKQGMWYTHILVHTYIHTYTGQDMCNGKKPIFKFFF